MSAGLPDPSHADRVLDDGAPLTTLELLEVYQRALYEALTRADDNAPEWAYLNHQYGVAFVREPDQFVPGGDAR